MFFSHEKQCFFFFSCFLLSGVVVVRKLKGMPVGKYGKWVDLGPSTEAVASPVVRVVAIPQAGMGAWCFHGWQAKLPAGVELLPIELPGRNSRMGEAKAENMRACVTDMKSGLASVLASPTPYVLLGHSLGALMAYELACETKPLALVVSGTRAASLSSLDHDVDREAPSLSELDSRDFWHHFERRYGSNPDLQSEGVKRYVEPMLRADFKLLETYEWTPKKQLRAPIVACAARGDDRVAPDQLQKWADHTEASFDTKYFDAKPFPWSTPHRYLVESPDEFIQFLGAFCLDLLKASSPSPSNAVNPGGGAYVVASKKGALVRTEASLDSSEVDILQPGTRVSVVEVREPGAAGKKPRARISDPVEGWLSCHLLAPTP